MANNGEQADRMPRPRVVRTVLYEDIYVSDWELQLWHTATLQRMYDLRQLGFADRVFPDAVHSRFNHSIGAVEMTERIVQAVRRNLSEEIRKSPAGGKGLESIHAADGLPKLLEHLDENADVLRIATLLHDITHVPYGHTLEDEVFAFHTKHDDPTRQCRFLNQLFYEFIDGLFESLQPSALFSSLQAPDTQEDRFRLTESRYHILKRIESQERLTTVQGFDRFCEVLRNAQILLLHLHEPRAPKDYDSLSSVRLLGRHPFTIDWDHYLLDIIANTICADLLDYSRRDSFFSGLKLNFDNRIFRYFEIRKVDGIYRLAIRTFTTKVRLDVLSEILNILKMRYLLSERVIFHPTKCAAGAMLGRVVSLLNITDPEDDFYKLGDREFLTLLQRRASFLIHLSGLILKILRREKYEPKLLARAVHTSEPWELERVLHLLDRCELVKGQKPLDLGGADRTATEGLDAFVKVLTEGGVNDDIRLQAIRYVEERLAEALGAARLSRGLLSRRFVKPVYQITKQAAVAREVYGDDIAERFRSPEEREKEERYVEDRAGLPRGSIIFYCPRKRTTLKAADVLVVWSKTRTQKFRDIDNEVFASFVEESNTIEQKYKSIWNMYVFTDEALLPFASLIQKIVYERLHVENSQLLINYLDEDPRVHRLSSDMRIAEDVLREALSRTFKVARGYELQSAASFGEFPDFFKVLRESFNAAIDEREGAIE